LFGNFKLCSEERKREKGRGRRGLRLPQVWARLFTEIYNIAAMVLTM
jgi:hypothetical protein